MSSSANHSSSSDTHKKSDKGKKSSKESKDEGTSKSGPMASLIKLRRRLTVGGQPETVDGVSKTPNADEYVKQDSQKPRVRCAVSAYSGVSKKGHAPYNPRKKNQDALIMHNDPSTSSLILCVLDGHGEHGDAVSGYIRDKLAKDMMQHKAWKTDIKKASREAIHKIEQSIIRNFRIDTEFSGTTLSMAIIRGNKIVGVNIGDSRIIIGKQVDGKLVAEEFTHDHKPESPGERERIIAAGGRVFAVEYDDGIDGPPRVWLGHMDVPGLAMSRSLGDSVAHTAGVISDPDFTERILDPKSDQFVVLATDGLWEFCKNDETVEMAHDASEPSESVEKLVQEASARWIKEEQVIDDTTVIVANLFDYKGGRGRGRESKKGKVHESKEA